MTTDTHGQNKSNRWLFTAIGFLLGLGNPIGTVLFVWVFAGFDPAEVNTILSNRPEVFVANAIVGCGLLSLAGFWVGHMLSTTEEERNKARYRAAHDSLTGLWNHRYILQRLSDMVMDPRSENRPFCAVMVDIDFFKQVNDTYGHLVGDHVLQQVAGILLEEVRDSDYVGRYGGEEFLMLLTRTDLEGAHVVLERLMQKIRQTHFKAPGQKGKGLRLTVSMGVAASTEVDNGNANDLVALADDRLLDGKREGRDRVMYPPGFQTPAPNPTP